MTQEHYDTKLIVPDFSPVHSEDTGLLGPNGGRIYRDTYKDNPENQWYAEHRPALERGTPTIAPSFMGFVPHPEDTCLEEKTEQTFAQKHPQLVRGLQKGLTYAGAAAAACVPFLANVGSAYGQDAYEDPQGGTGMGPGDTQPPSALSERLYVDFHNQIDSLEGGLNHTNFLGVRLATGSEQGMLLDLGAGYVKREDENNAFSMESIHYQTSLQYAHRFPLDNSELFLSLGPSFQYSQLNALGEPTKARFPDIDQWGLGLKGQLGGRLNDDFIASLNLGFDWGNAYGFAKQNDSLRREEELFRGLRNSQQLDFGFRWWAIPDVLYVDGRVLHARTSVDNLLTSSETGVLANVALPLSESVELNLGATWEQAMSRSNQNKDTHVKFGGQGGLVIQLADNAQLWPFFGVNSADGVQATALLRFQFGGSEKKRTKEQ